MIHKSVIAVRLITKRLSKRSSNSISERINTCIVSAIDSDDDYPILVMGRGTGFLKHPGVHHRAVGENTSTVLLTLLRAAGLSLTEFGQAGGHVTTSCSAIEA